MHNLEEQIADWKKSITSAESLHESDLSELEQHLRDAIADLQKRGLNLQEAFLVAASRLGTYDALDTEFRKINGSYLWQRRVFWMLAGYLLMGLAGRIMSGVGSIGASIAAFEGASGTVVGAISVCVTVVGWGCLLVCMYALAHGQGHGILSHSVTITPTTLILVVLGILAGGTMLSVGGHVLTARLVSVQTLGQAVVVTSVANYAIQLAIPLICLGMMLSLRQRTRAAVG